MNLPSSLQDAVRDAGAQVRLGYPWWLRRLLMRDVIGITLGRRIYVRPNVSAEAIERLLRHELVHVRQINRLGLVRFYLQYVREFVQHYRAVRSVTGAYRLISFEVEAAAAEEGL
jgi:transposase InsO family protein